MHQTSCLTDEARWTHRKALERRFGLPRGLLLNDETGRESLIARAITSTGLDGATLERLNHILTVTVADWIKK